MPSIHYIPTGLQRTVPDGTSEELCFVLLVDEDVHMTITTKPYKLLPITGGSQIPTRSTRFPPNADFVSSPMGTAILTGELMVLVGGRFVNSEEEEEEEEKRNKKEEEELAIPWRRCFERAGRGQLEVEQVVEQGERAFDTERDSPIVDDYPEAYVEEHPRGPPPSPTITTTHLPTPLHARWLGGPSLPPSAPHPRYISKFFPQPDIRSLTIAERRVRTRLAGGPTAGSAVRFPPERIDVALAEGFERETMPGLHL